MLRGRRHWAARYGVAALAVALTFAIKELLDLLVQVESPFLLLSIAVLVGAVYGGLGPGVFASLLAALVGDYFFLSQVGAIVPSDLGHGLTTLLFLAQGVAISAIGARLVSARGRVERTLESLSESEERYRMLVESVRDYAIFAMDTDGRVVDWNVGAERLFGYSEEEIVGKPSSLLFTPEDRQQGAHEEELRRARDEGRAQDERWHVRKDGTRFWASGFVRPIWDQERNLCGFSKVTRDITERKEAEDALRLLAESSEVLSSSLDYQATLSSVAHMTVPSLADWCAVDILEEDGSLERLVVVHEDPEKVLPAYELQERYPPDPDDPSGVWQVLRTGESELVMEITDELLDEVAADEELVELVRELGLKSYIVVPLIARGRTLGAITLVSAESGRRYEQDDLQIAEDLARRAAVAIDNARLYEEAKKAAEVRARLAAIVESSDDAIISKTLEGIITSWNQGAQKIYGYTAEEAVGKPIDILVPSDHPDEIPNIMARLKRGEAIDHYETERITKDGRELNISLSISPIRDLAGNIVGASVIARDITERKRTEEALREVREAERKRMARDLHDGVLQDLSYALAEAQLARILSEDQELDDRLGQVVSALQRGAQGLREAVYDLSLHEERDRPFSESLEVLLEMSRQTNPGTNIRLELQSEIPSTSLGATGVELLRIIQEALNNVRRHSGAENVLVRLRTEDNELVAEVEDDGRGFDTSITQVGIGQRSMRERTAAFGGRLEVESEPGKGAKVRVCAPLGIPNGEKRS